MSPEFTAITCIYLRSLLDLEVDYWFLAPIKGPLNIQQFPRKNIHYVSWNVGGGPNVQRGVSQIDLWEQNRLDNLHTAIQHRFPKNVLKELLSSNHHLGYVS